MRDDETRAGGLSAAERARREARKFGTDVPHRPTDEFVRHAFAEGARALWPDSRDPGWHVTFDRWLAARATASAEAIAAVIEAHLSTGLGCKCGEWRIDTSQRPVDPRRQHRRHVAAVLAAQPGPDIAAVKAEAWDEGAREGYRLYDMAFRYVERENPYRAAQTPQHEREAGR